MAVYYGMNQKGGEGKTTTIKEMGVALALKGKKVLLIDADSQGSLTTALGFREKYPAYLYDILKRVMNGETIPPDYGVLHHNEGVDLIPSSIALASLESDLIEDKKGGHNVLKQYVDQVKQNYDYVLIDGMPSLSKMTVNSLVAADSVIIPSQPDFLSIQGLKLLMQSVIKTRKRYNPSLKIGGILFTMVDGRTTNDAKAIMSELRSYFGNSVKVFKTQIPRSVREREAHKKGVSIFTHDAKGKVATAYTALAKEVAANERSARIGTSR